MLLNLQFLIRLHCDKSWDILKEYFMNHNLFVSIKGEMIKFYVFVRYLLYSFYTSGDCGFIWQPKGWALKKIISFIALLQSIKSWRTFETKCRGLATRSLAVSQVQFTCRFSSFQISSILEGLRSKYQVKCELWTGWNWTKMSTVVMSQGEILVKHFHVR